MSDNAETDHEDAANDELQQYDGGKAFQCRTGKISVKGLDAKGCTSQEHDPAEQRYQLHGNTGKRGDVAYGVFDKA